ncbi:DNA polymerase III alpha subunit [Mycobacteroides abscessus subsp. abscessus]|nr:DNA polymerase III alpha subunit [Mycobacteroides abscessus subsp. abscessus]
MVRYATEKWGSDRVAQVITFGTIKTKAALKDSARIHYGQPGFAIADRITKALPPPIMAKDIPVWGITNPEHERYKEAAEVRTLIDTDPDVRNIYQTALGLEGLIRNAGVHACAVIMSSEPLTDAIPLWKRAQDGAIITGWDYPSCEAIGLLKMDFLGLRNLTVIGDALDNIKANRGIDLDLDHLPLDDPATYELLSRGDTLGVFQLDGGPMRDLLRRMQPTGFNDIVAVLALYRPGPMGMNAHNDYADRKNGRQPIKPIHPELEEPLKDIPVWGITNPEHERYKEAAEVRTLIDTDPDVRNIYQTALGLEGLIRNAGVHACAVIMSSEPLTDAIPLWKRAQDGAIITGWDYPSCEAIGLLKMDFLGLRNLTVIGDALDNIKANRGIDLDLDHLPLDDPATYELLSRGDTLGVFQLDGGPMRDLLRRMQPTGFNDIVAVLALYRPGPMGMNAHNDYADRKNGRQPIKPIHPELEEPLKDILAETFGLIVYQEQIMFIAQKVASYSMGKADALRKAMGKKKLEVLEAEYKGFYEGMTNNGFSEKAVKALWDTILPFAGYAFNKSHAAGYGLVSFWTAYLKANYPAEYMAGLLTSVGDDKDKAAVYLADCRRLGITVLPPDVNESVHNFASVGEDIRYGLGGVRNVGANVVQSLIATREEKGAFTDFSDYLHKIDIAACNKKVTESLVKAGAFDSLGHPRKGLFLVQSDAVDSVLGTKKAEAMGQFDLFGGGGEDSVPASDIFAIKVPDDEWEEKHKLALEREMLGLYVSGHPLNGVAHLLSRQTDTQIPAILDGEVANDAVVKVGGILASVNRRVNKNGMPWASAQLEDLTGGIEVLFFPQAYSVYGADIADDAVVLVNAKVAIRDDRVSLIANDLVVPDFSQAADDRPVAVTMPTRQCTIDKVTALKQVLTRHPGTNQVHLRLISGERVTTLELDQSLRVTPSSALMGDLKALLGPGCLGG